MMVYGNTHRFLLRLISSQSVLSLKDTERILAANFGNAQINIQQMIKEINENIKHFQQNITIKKDEVTSENFVIFLSHGYDQTAKEQNVFSRLELEFFRVLIDQIMSTETREISAITAINLVNNIKVDNKHLSKIDAQRVLDLWCRMRYLDLEDDNNYALGLRTINEFQIYFRENMPDVIDQCYICKEMVFRGCNCPACGKAIHNRCLEAYLGKAQKWPCCKSTYIHSELESLRGQVTPRSERTVDNNFSLSLASTQPIETQSQQSTREVDLSMEPTQLIPEVEETLGDAVEEMDVVEQPVTDSSHHRRRKRMRLNS